MAEAPPESVVDVAARTPYPPEAFAFLREGLHSAAIQVHGPQAELVNPALASKRHVSGEQLCEALRDLAIRRWGLMAKTVLHNWHIHSTLDFGKIVYAMIDNHLMQKTDRDNLEDFRDTFDFAQAFSPESCLRVRLP